ncbi:MAG: hypothetical protein MJY79_00715, partial [Bacteroidaceae bacterium]|nr:hypothetical protein [Bacteroidaceae bacterium]
QDVEEILASFENIQIQLTQFYNTFWDELNGDEPGMTDEEAAELFMTEYESLQKQFTMVYNTTVNADSIEMKADSAFISRQTFILNSIYKNMAELETWAMESMEAGTLAQDVEEILASFENIQIQLTQFYNTFWEELNGGEDDPTLSNEEAWMMFVEDFGEFYDLLNLDVENLLNIFFGEMIDSADITMEDVAAIVGDSAIMEIQYNFDLAKKVVGEFYARAEASYNNGTFGEQYYDFMAEVDESIEYVIERLSDSLEAIVEKVAREIVSQMFMQAVEQAQIGLTQIYNATINNPDYEKYSAELESLIPEFNKISMYLQSIVDTASVYYENGVLVDRIDEISDMLDKLGLMLVQFENDFESVLANAIKVSVDTPESDSVNTEIFTINGVKVDNMNEPGIYIVNGKKIVVR